MSRPIDRLLLLAARGSALISAGVVALIIGFLVRESWPAVAQVGTRFATDATWHPAARPADGTFAMGPLVVGTLLVSGLALLVAVPLGVCSALCCNCYAPPRIARVLRTIFELLAGIPSVVFGLWGLVVLVPLVARVAPPGQSLATAALVLAMMLVPTVALMADLALRRALRAHQLSAAALGLSHGAVVWRVLLPAARNGIATGCLLATGRALGETMAVMMVSGNLVQVPGSVFDPVRTLTANIALEMAYAMDVHRGALFVGGLLLVAIVAVLVLAAESLTSHPVLRR